MMEKKYLVSEDEFSGQVVIICRTYEKEVDVYAPTEQEMLANQYLYREIPTQMENRTFYEVSAYYHYEDEQNRMNNRIFLETASNKEKANELFKQIVLFCK